MLSSLKNIRLALARPNADPIAALASQIDQLQKKIENGKLSSSLSTDAEYACHCTIASLEEMQGKITEASPANGIAAFILLKTDFDNRTQNLKKQAEAVGEQLSKIFRFCEEVFQEDQEMLILVTELTAGYYTARFISRYGCREYFNHNKELLFYERQKEIIQELEKFELED